MKEGKGGDHLSVGVKVPGRSRPQPISKEDVFVRPPGKLVFCGDVDCIHLYYTVLCCNILGCIIYCISLHFIQS